MILMHLLQQDIYALPSDHCSFTFETKHKMAPCLSEGKHELVSTLFVTEENGLLR